MSSRYPMDLVFLAHGNPNAEVIGLDQFPKEETPPLIIHYFFDLMVTIGGFMVVLSLVYWIGMKRAWSFVKSKWYRWLIVLGGPLSSLRLKQAGGWLRLVDNHGFYVE